MKNTSEHKNKEVNFIVGQKIDNRKHNISFIDDNEFRDTVLDIVIY